MPRGCSRGGDYHPCHRVWEPQPAAQRGHSSGRGTCLRRGETQIAPKPREKSGGVVGWQRLCPLALRSASSFTIAPPVSLMILNDSPSSTFKLA